MTITVEDARPAPLPRKNQLLWQTYLWWRELMEIRKRHLLRISSSERGKSNFDGDYERAMIEELKLDIHVKPRNKAEREVSVWQAMVKFGEAVGPIWFWCLEQKGLGESLTAQLLAQVDDIERFDTVSKLWRHSGFGIYQYWVNELGEPQVPIQGYKWTKVGDERVKVLTICRPREQWNGVADAKYIEPKPGWKLVKHRDVNLPGYHSPYNRLLKSIGFNIADMFIRHQSSPWVDVYYEQKEYQRSLHPEPIKGLNGKKIFTDAHVHNRAWRKMIKRFLREFWIEWRKSEGLPIEDS